MQRSLAVLLLALGACQSTSSDYSAAPAAGTTTNSTAVRALNQVSSSANTASQVGTDLGKQGLAANAAAVAQTADALATDLAGKSAGTAVATDPSARFEYQDVYTTLGDPEGMRALVPYLLHPDTWMLVKCEMLSTTEKHYRFQKISTGTGRVMPDVDIFKGRK
ncbi:MAG TPA: hypothetical protein VNM14_06800 [Planctomycetota bacterium]|jgi:hypothetical protein|nr:hypothetical protein [Planctomycetota bacterium]